MKTLIRNITALLLCLSLAGLTANAVTYSVSAGNGNSDSNGGDPWAPSGACVQWYCYSYGSASAYVSVGGPVSIEASAPYNGSADGYEHTMSAGTLSIRLGCQTSSGGSAGGAVTVMW